VTTHRDNSDGQMSLAMLAVSYPEFRITLEPHGWHELRWAAVRVTAADPGLYAVITPDLGELRAVLAAAVGRPGGSDVPGSREAGLPR
jgi:hypothetical protein